MTLSLVQPTVMAVEDSNEQAHGNVNDGTMGES